MSERFVGFDRELLALFAEASHDHNPLHVSAEYAKATPYGEPVVFGVLSGLAVLAELPDVQQAGQVRLSFPNPVFLNQRYEITITDTEDGHRGELWNSGQLAVSVTVGRSVPDTPGKECVLGEPSRMRDCPANPTADRLGVGSAVDGRYQPGGAAELVSHLGLGEELLDSPVLPALLWSSYLVGMELPGRQALLGELTLTLLPGATGCPSGGQADEFLYHAEVAHVDRRFNLMRLTAWLCAGTRPTAGAKASVFVRPEPTRIRLVSR